MNTLGAIAYITISSFAVTYIIIMDKFKYYSLCCNMLDMVTVDTSVVLLASMASSTEQTEIGSQLVHILIWLASYLKYHYFEYCHACRGVR